MIKNHGKQRLHKAQSLYDFHVFFDPKPQKVMSQPNRKITKSDRVLRSQVEQSKAWDKMAEESKDDPFDLVSFCVRSTWNCGLQSDLLPLTMIVVNTNVNTFF